MSATLTKVLTNAASQRAALADVLAELRAQAGASWTAEMAEAGDFILRVVRLNPKRSLESILAQPDVKDALTTPFKNATLVTQSAIKQGWETGQNMGVNAALRNLSTIGFDGNYGAFGNQSMLNKVLQDADNNGKSAAQRLVSLAADGKATQQELDSLVDDLTRRAEYGVNFAMQKAYSEAEEASYAKAAAEEGAVIKKMWVTRFGPGTCLTCAALHGTIRTLGEAFPDMVTFGTGLPPKPYGLLNGPPRHPNCRCRLVPFITKMANPGGATPKKMGVLARGWFAQQFEENFAKSNLPVLSGEELALGWVKVI